MGTDLPPVNLTSVGETPLRSRQSTSPSTVQRTVNLIKEHMSESPRTYADIVGKLTTTPKRYAELESRGHHSNAVEAPNVKTRNFRSISYWVLSCLWVINTISCFIHVCMMFIWREQVVHLIFHVVSSLLAK